MIWAIRKDPSRDTRDLENSQSNEHYSLARLAKILKEFRNLKAIASVRSGAEKQLISSICDDTGKVVLDRDEIAEVFAAFYEGLYQDDEANQEL